MIIPEQNINIVKLKALNNNEERSSHSTPPPPTHLILLHTHYKLLDWKNEGEMATGEFIYQFASECGAQ